MARDDSIQSTEPVRNVSNNSSLYEAMAPGGKNSPEVREATDLLGESGITADSVPKDGLKDKEGNSYTFDEAVGKVSDMVQQRDNAGTQSEKRDLSAKIDDFIGQLAESLKPPAASQDSGSPAQAPAPASSPAPAPAPAPSSSPAQGSGSSAGSSGLPAAAQSALDNISPSDLMSMLGSDDETGLDNLIKQMLAAGASPEQIKSALKEKAKGAIEAQGAKEGWSPQQIQSKIDAADKKIDGAVDKTAAVDKSTQDPVKTFA